MMQIYMSTETLCYSCCDCKSHISYLATDKRGETECHKFYRISFLVSVFFKVAAFFKLNVSLGAKIHNHIPSCLRQSFYKF